MEGIFKMKCEECGREVKQLLTIKVCGKYGNYCKECFLEKRKIAMENLREQYMRSETYL